MENAFAPYECQFSIEERKKIVAQAIQEIRKAKNFSQKEVAMLLGLSQPRYSGYETGRAEPPIEILVRLSYLFDVSVDMLTQRDRLHRTSKDIQRKINQLKQQIEEIEATLMESGSETTAAALDGMKKLLQERQTAIHLSLSSWEALWKNEMAPGAGSIGQPQGKF